MKVLDMQKVRDLFYYGRADKPIISEEIDKAVVYVIDECMADVEVKTVISEVNTEVIRVLEKLQQRMVNNVTGDEKDAYMSGVQACIEDAECYIQLLKKGEKI